MKSFALIRRLCDLLSARKPPPAPPLKTVPQVVLEFLVSKQDAGVGTKWQQSLRYRLGQLAAAFPAGPIIALNGADLDAWLRSLNIRPRTRKNYRDALSELFAFAQARKYLPRQWHEMEAVGSPKVRHGEIKILTPAQMVKLMAAARPNLWPWLACTAWGGVRAEEMVGQKKILQWSDIDFDARQIFVPAAAAKMGVDRVIPIQPNLFDWLQICRQDSGPVCPLKGAFNALSEAKRKAGIAAGRGESTNTLRKSFISYRLAVCKNVAQVAEEAGNSPAIIRLSYKRAVPEAHGKLWFEIRPPAPETLLVPVVRIPSRSHELHPAKHPS
jgi:integrase